MNNIFEYFNNKNDTELLIVSDDKQSQVASDILEYNNKMPFVLSDLRANFGDDLLSFADEIQNITTILDKFFSYKKKNKILVAPIRTITFALPKEKYFDKFSINFADSININSLKEKLYLWGYYFVDIVTKESEVSIRGDIIDIYPPNDDFGYRISLFDEEVESIRKFDVGNQKSYKDELEGFTIHPAFLALNNYDMNKINKRIELGDNSAFISNIHSLGFWYLEDIGEFYSKKLRSIITKEAIEELDEVYILDKKRIIKDDILKIDILPNSNKYKQIKPSNIKEFIKFHKDKKITIISNTQAKVHGQELLDYNIVYKHWIINLISKNEIILSLNNKMIKRRKRRIRIILDELKKGDFVVHEDHGIGKFEGILPIEIMGATRDFVKLLYANDDKLFIPVENIDIIDRYIADCGNIAILDKLGKGSFAKLKLKVKSRLFAIANDIIELAAKRELTHGSKIDTKKEEIDIFQNNANFEYTKDQIKSINELFADLESGTAMDRLLSGDVGFGKTEVAMNGLLACFLNGYQSIFVCPTTLLSSQHFIGLKQRLESFGVKIGKIDGKTKTSLRNYYKEEFENGNIDILIGTHSLLNIKSNNIALVIIDEEHKFGVKQKEKLKNIRNDVHIFSMSATPIPRTLNLALSKIKGMSSLLTPPNDRLGVRSFVKEYNPKLIKEIILREKRRGGQLFYIHNSIANIESKKYDLLELLPTLDIAIMHSKIKPTDSERIMDNFKNGTYDILLATSIVESGLHLPNANSIIIDGANRFGIADLHQLRGRVGRGTKEGFCYFIVENKNTITQDAIRRLIALQNNSYLGSGANLAHQDLEIRGGGNIIGEAQSGHINKIGYSLYLKMLEDALIELSAKTKQEKKVVDIKLSISAFISSSYISEDRIRLELYRRFSKTTTKKEIYEIQDEMEDRFGRLDIPTKQFVDLIIIKTIAIQKDIKSISNYAMNISINFNNDSKKLIKSKSKDDDDLIYAVIGFLTKI